MPEPQSSESPKPPPSWSKWKDWIGKRWWLYPTATLWGPWWVLGQLNYLLARLPLFLLLEQIAVIGAVIFWFSEAGDRTKERHYRAWELINSARGSTGDGGRKDALQDLNRDRVSLAGAPLEQAYLSQIDLQGANLKEANLRGANLQDANLRGANLQDAKLQRAALWNAKLQDVDLWNANLQDAKLGGASLQDAKLGGASLQDAVLANANVKNANLRVRPNGLTQEQLDMAIGDYRTQLPDGLSRPAHWAKAEAPETPPAAQPDAAERAPAPSGASGSDK